MLDFDGVLHPRCPRSSSEMLKSAELLAKAVDGLEDISIVIDSTWRNYPADLQWALDRLPSKITDMVVGSTPILGGKKDREIEIIKWLDANIRGPYQLLIVDDEQELFNTLLSNLYCVNGETGLTEYDVQRVRNRLTKIV